MHPFKLELDEGQDYPACIDGNTLVLTSIGYKPLCEVSVGDTVFTHRRRWRKVLGTSSTFKPTVKVRGHGHPGIVASADHRFRVFHSVDGFRPLPCEDGIRRIESTPVLLGPAWKSAEDIVNDYWCTPTRFPKVSAPPSPVRQGMRRTGVFDERSEEALWLLGLYLSDGNASSSLVYTVNARKESEVTKRLEYLGVDYSVRMSSTSEHCVHVTVKSPLMRAWMVDNCGNGALVKQVPVWVYGLRTRWREAVLQGALYGDGFMDPDDRYSDGRWKFATAGKPMAASMRTLAATLDYYVSWYWVKDDHERVIRDRTFSMTNGGWYQIVGGRASAEAFDYDLMRYQRVRAVTPESIDPVELFDIEVEEDHSFVAEGVVVHNSGWVELGETLKYGRDGSQWRAHGVSRGVRDDFFKKSQPGSGWKVFNFTAMHREDWTDEERKAKAELYGSVDHPDYRRNILGQHGDASSSLFVLTRLMSCVDQDESSDYNSSVYTNIRLNYEAVQDRGLPIQELIDVPGTHKLFKRVWIGMDIGVTNHPTEILVFGEETVKTRSEQKVRLKLLTRIHLERISTPDQRLVLERLVDIYSPQCVALDRTGLGLPVYQEALEGKHPLSKVVKGFNFSEKVTVGWTQPDEDGMTHSIDARVLEYSSDQLRLLVDQGRLHLPWDVELIRDFQGQTYVIVKSSTDSYGRKSYSKGASHVLDAARMAVMGFQQAGVDVVSSKEPELVMDGWLDF